MKFKLVVSSKNYDPIKEELISKGFEIDEDADFVITEKDNFADYLVGKRGAELYRLPVSEITCVESFGHDVIAHTAKGDYNINERLRYLESVLNPRDFIRISNSVIVSLSGIEKIKPTMSAKFILTLVDGRIVDVTRTYYYTFRDTLGV